MEQVIGIGGFFFRADDPKKLGEWYQAHLGVKMVPDNYDDPAWTQEAGSTVFAPFPKDTDYFGDSTIGWMINFRVKNLDALAQQLEESGIKVERNAEEYPNGKFARIHDPEGNPIELWEEK